uniref:Uncharacterized protein n=1 Tax=Romanomermis culicivorax TaxID=13658 RepID=A0A915L4M3_ROMCU
MLSGHVHCITYHYIPNSMIATAAHAVKSIPRNFNSQNEPDEGTVPDDDTEWLEADDTEGREARDEEKT